MVLLIYKGRITFPLQDVHTNNSIFFLWAPRHSKNQMVDTPYTERTIYCTILLYWSLMRATSAVRTKYHITVKQMLHRLQGQCAVLLQSWNIVSERTTCTVGIIQGYKIDLVWLKSSKNPTVRYQLSTKQQTDSWRLAGDVSGAFSS